MKEITKSASKLVFIGLMATACFAFLIGVYKGTVVMTTEQYMLLATASATFYFSRKGESDKPFEGK